MKKNLFFGLMVGFSLCVFSFAAEPKKDPVATAFAMPRGVAMSGKQQAAYNKLKRENEKVYRAAIEKTIKTTDATEKRKAAKEAHDIREKINNGMKDIIAIPIVDAQKEAIRQSNDYYNKIKSSGHGCGSGCK